MSATNALQAEVAQIDAQIAKLQEARQVRIEALRLLAGTGEATVKAAVVVTNEHVSKIDEMVRAAGRQNVQDVRSLLRQSKMSQRDLAAQLDIAPGSVSKAVQALQAMGEIFPAGKEGRSPVWTTKINEAAEVVTVGQDPW